MIQEKIEGMVEGMFDGMNDEVIIKGLHCLYYSFFSCVLYK